MRWRVSLTRHAGAGDGGLEADGELLLARLNRDLLEAEISLADGQEELGELKLVAAPGCGAGGASGCCPHPHPGPPPSRGREI